MLIANRVTVTETQLSSVGMSVSHNHDFISPPDPFVAQNRSLDYLRGTLGFSYMCREMQTLGVAPDFAINTFQVQVQPFGVTGNQYAAGKRWLGDQVGLFKMVLNHSLKPLSSS